MDYEKSALFNGNPEKALDLARNTFLPLGFTITKTTSVSIEMSGPNIIMPRLSYMKDLLFGISKISFIVNENISIKAEFGGIRKWFKFTLTVMTVSMIPAMIIVGILLYKKGVPVHYIVLMPPALFAFLLIPVINRKGMKWMLTRSLNELFNKMSAAF